MKKKGFTLVELLVVIAIIALLMGILMPALARVRQIAYRMICGTHLKGIGSSILLYANDNGEDYPAAGTKSAVWSGTGKITDYQGADISNAFGGTTGRPSTITACLYMLLKNYDMTPAQFVCKGDSGAKEFKLSDCIGLSSTSTMLSIYDFGGGSGTDYPMPGQYNSYAYHDPFKGVSGDTAYPVNATSAPGSPVCSDRNPYLDKNAKGVYLDGSAQPAGSEAAPSWDDTSGYKDLDKSGNCAAHQREGQNVLYNDNHASFEKFPNVGIQNDNIWKHWPDSTEPTDDIRQVAPLSPNLTPDGKNGGAGNKPMSDKDAYLVSEKNSS